MPINKRYIQSPGITERVVDDVIFLVNPANEALYHLNPTGAALWRLLEEGTCARDAIAIICQAFPDADLTTVTTDINNLIIEFKEHHLIVSNND